MLRHSRIYLQMLGLSIALCALFGAACGQESALSTGTAASATMGATDPVSEPSGVIPLTACQAFYRGTTLTARSLAERYPPDSVSCSVGHVTSGNKPCSEPASAAAAECPTTPRPELIMVLTTPGGFATCIRPLASTEPVCGIESGGQTDTDHSGSWVFSPYPTGATPVSAPACHGTGPCGSSQTATPFPTVPPDPVGGCVVNGTQEWTFYVASQKFVPGKCPAPWN